MDLAGIIEPAIEAVRAAARNKAIGLTAALDPGEDGYDLIRRVRRLEVVRGRHLPAIAPTAYTGAEDRRRTLHAGYDTHVAKPVEASAFAPLIASLLPRERGA